MAYIDLSKWKVNGYNKVVECPFDKSHQILEHRLQTHLLKCARNHKGSAKTHCPFNIMHIVNEADLSKHVEVCPNRIALDFSDTKKGNGKEKEILQKQMNDDDENMWDDNDSKSYNPRLYCDNAPVRRKAPAVSKKGRKEFREKERVKFLQMRKEE